MKQNNDAYFTRLRMKAKFYKGLADSTRLGILEVLRKGEKTVSQIVELTEKSQSNVSNHLNCLRECGVVAHRQEGKNVYCSIADKKLLKLLADTDKIVAGAIDKLYSCMVY